MTTISIELLGSSCVSYREHRLTPSSPQLFAAALFLCTERERHISRQELQQLLLAPEASRSARSHNLRQLLYRLSSTGFPLYTNGVLVRCDAQVIQSDVTALRELTPEDRAQLPVGALAVLPEFSQPLSPSFDNWLEALRNGTYRTLRELLSGDLVVLSGACDWDRAALTARILLSLDPLNYSAVKVLVEAAIVRSDFSEALATIDRFLDDCENPSPTRRLAERLRRTIAPRRRAGSSFPFVGRADTLAALSEAWTRTANGCTQYVLLTGPAGIGKTRVSTAIRELIVSRGGQVIAHVCHDTDRHQPLSLFVHLARELGGMPGSLGVSPPALSQLKRLVFERPDSTLTGSDAISSEIARAELHDALADLFDAVSSECELLVVVDDAHFLDPASWAVLRTLTARVRTRPAMVLLCTRSTGHIKADSSPLPYTRVIPLGPLSDNDSRSLLLALTTPGFLGDAQVTESVRLAGGNPFYLQAIARHPRRASSDAIPFDISALAARSYLSLDDEARTVLECVLLLNSLASLERVQTIVQLDGFAFLRALRVLEEDGLLHCVGNDLKCPHHLLSEALRPLLPTSVVAALRQRIAMHLEAECIERRFDGALAWSAAQAWMEVGRTSAATRLLRQCASYAASLAEHSEAARMLARLLPVELPDEEALGLIDEVIAYSEAGGERSIRARALRERLRHMKGPSAIPSEQLRRELCAVRVARAEADLNEVEDIAPVVAELRDLVADEQLEPELRMRAGISVLIAADLSLDQGVATQCWDALRPIRRTLGAAHTQALRAKLIFHTVFGAPSVAASTARRILGLHPLASLEFTSVMSRRNALFALAILGEGETFMPGAIAAFDHMIAQKVYTEAVYVSVSLADHLMAAGDFGGALNCLARAGSALSRVAESAAGVTLGYLSSLSLIAFWSGDYDTAARILSHVRERFHLLATPRLRALSSAHKMRLRLTRGEVVDERDFSQLLDYYDRGARLGRQDTVVETLWLAHRQRDATDCASELLREYLETRRRERCAADWSFWHSTRSDPVWRDHLSLIPRLRDPVPVDHAQLRELVSRTEMK
jgi:DNA-binding SARP family transcriptional activator